MMDYCFSLMQPDFLEIYSQNMKAKYSEFWRPLVKGQVMKSLCLLSLNTIYLKKVIKAVLYLQNLDLKFLAATNYQFLKPFLKAKEFSKAKILIVKWVLFDVYFEMQK